MTNRQPGSSDLQWQVCRHPRLTFIGFFGSLDESADLSMLSRHLAGSVVFLLAGMDRINSAGVRAWIDFVHDLPRVTRLEYRRCSLAFVRQLNLIRNFRGPASVYSFYAPYVCDGCDREQERLLLARACTWNGDRYQGPEFDCEECGLAMELDELPERHFSFLAELQTG